MNPLLVPDLRAASLPVRHEKCRQLLSPRIGTTFSRAALRRSRQEYGHRLLAPQALLVHLLDTFLAYARSKFNGSKVQVCPERSEGSFLVLRQILSKLSKREAHVVLLRLDL